MISFFHTKPQVGIYRKSKSISSKDTDSGSLSINGAELQSQAGIRPRRAFKKSRRGCRTCKIRKVKCDENHPLCRNCERRFPGLKTCDFDHFTEVSVEPLEKTKQQYTELSSLLSLRPPLAHHLDGLSSREDFRVLELRLMHHYSTETCMQLPDGHLPNGKYVWSKDIPRLAFQSDLVLSALLSMSALHHWALTPNDSRLSFAAKHYFDRAVHQHRIALSNADSQSAEALLATAILITHFSWLASHSVTSNEPYEIPLQAYYIAKGLRPLISQMWPWLWNSRYTWITRPIEEVDVDSQEDAFSLSLREDLTILSKTFDEKGISPTDKAVLKAAVKEITAICLAISSGAPQGVVQRRVATMPSRSPRRFLELLEEKDPRALALLARDLALLKVIERVWWLHGTGSSQCVAENAVAGIAAMIPKPWQWVMEWPLKVVSGHLRPGTRQEQLGAISNSLKN